MYIKNSMGPRTVPGTLGHTGEDRMGGGLRPFRNNSLPRPGPRGILFLGPTQNQAQEVINYTSLSLITKSLSVSVKCEKSSCSKCKTDLRLSFRSAVNLLSLIDGRCALTKIEIKLLDIFLRLPGNGGLQLNYITCVNNFNL